VRIAVVTGASQGLGLELARRLHEEGWALVIDARRGERLEAATKALGGGSEVLAVPGDVANPHHREELVAAARRLGRVSLVVNNASTLGPTPLRELLELGAGHLLEIYNVNTVAPLALVAALRGDLAEGATVLNITSDAGAEPYAGWGGYGSSKAALEHASAVLALEEPALRVLVVDPGDMRTEMHAAAFPGEDISDRPEAASVVPALLALIEGGQPSGRYLASTLLEEQREATR